MPGFGFTVSRRDKEAMAGIFVDEKTDRVIHLAAQAGVRYSLENLHAYIDANLQGFMNILYGCRHNDVAHLAMPVHPGLWRQRADAVQRAS